MFFPNWPPLSWHKQCHFWIPTTLKPHSEPSGQYPQESMPGSKSILSFWWYKRNRWGQSDHRELSHHPSLSKWLGLWYATMLHSGNTYILQDMIIRGSSLPNSFWFSLEYCLEILNWFSRQPRRSKELLLMMVIMSRVIKGRKCGLSWSLGVCGGEWMGSKRCAPPSARCVDFFVNLAGLTQWHLLIA